MSQRKPYRLTLELQGLTKTQADVMTWRARVGYRKHWHKRVAGMVLGQTPRQPLERVRFRFTRCSSSEPDHDGLVASFKVLQDAVVQAGILVDDKPQHIESAEYRWQYAAPKQGRVILEIEEVIP